MLRIAQVWKNEDDMVTQQKFTYPEKDQLVSRWLRLALDWTVDYEIERVEDEENNCGEPHYEVYLEEVDKNNCIKHTVMIYQH